MYAYLPLSWLLGDWDKALQDDKSIYKFITEVLYFHEIEINPFMSKEKSANTFAEGCTMWKSTWNF